MVENKPSALTVLIPSMGRSILIQTLESVFAVEGSEAISVIVLGKFSNPEVAEALERMLKQRRNLRHLEVQFEHGDLSQKKNLGLKEAKTDLVAVIDDDLLLPKTWLNDMLALFDDEKVGMVCGPSLVPEDIDLGTRLSGLALASKAAGFVSDRYRQQGDEPYEVNWSKMIGCNMVFRKAIVEEQGGFNPDIIPGEDLLAALALSRAGQKLMIQPKAYVWHYPRQSVQKFFKQVYRFGAARIRMMRHGVPFQWTTLVPGLWVLFLAAGLVAKLFSQNLFHLWLWGLAAYLLLCVFVVIETVAHTRRWKDLALFFYIPVMHLGYGLGEWMEWLRGGKNLKDSA